MKHILSGASLLAVVTFVVPSEAAPHLGMKLACKRYGDAWNSGSRSALASQVTGDFAQMFRRMPNQMFADLPRGGGAKVLSSSKGNGSGTVTVATSQGVITLVLVGRGFHWRVADLYKAGDDGRTVSLKSYLDAVLTSREFMVDLKYKGGRSFYDSTTRGFQSAFAELSVSDLNRIRDFLPDIRDDVKPYVTMNGTRATMFARFPGEEGYARFDLVREGSWKVDDYAVELPHASIASFRNSLDTIAAVGKFRDFMLAPGQFDPTEFTAVGPLQNSLLKVHANGCLPMKQIPSAMKKCTIDKTGEHVHIALLDRQVKINLDRSGLGAIVEQVEITMGNRFADLGHLIALNERARGMLAFAGVAQPAVGAADATAFAVATEREKPASKAADSALTNASATEVVTAAKIDANVRPAVARPSAPAVKTASYQVSAGPTYHVPHKRIRFVGRRCRR